MNDRKLIYHATEACAEAHAETRKARRKLAGDARAVIYSRHGIWRALQKPDAEISAAEAVALLAMVKVKRAIEAGTTASPKTQHAKDQRAAMIEAYQKANAHGLRASVRRRWYAFKFRMRRLFRGQ